MMRFLRLIFVIFLSSLLACQTPAGGGGSSNSPKKDAESFSQTINQIPFSEQEKEEALRSIQKDYEKLQDARPQFEEVSFDFDGDFAAETLRAWKKEEKWVILKHRQQDGHGFSAMEYYFREGKLFFYLHHSEYALIHEEAENHVKEERLYLGGETVLQSLRKEQSFAHDETVEMSGVANEKAVLEDPQAKYQFLQKESDRLLSMVEKFLEQD